MVMCLGLQIAKQEIRRPSADFRSVMPNQLYVVLRSDRNLAINPSYINNHAWDALCVR
jgi:hypothetical protein